MTGPRRNTPKRRVVDPNFWTQKEAFLRWKAALKIRRVNAPNQKEPLARPEGQGGRGGHQVAQDGGADRTDVRCPSNASRELEKTGTGRSTRCFRHWPRADPPAVRHREGRTI